MHCGKRDRIVDFNWILELSVDEKSTILKDGRDLADSDKRSARSSIIIDIVL